MFRKAQWVVLVTLVSAGVMVAAAGAAGPSKRVPCKLSVSLTRHLAPQGVSGTGSIRCTQPERTITLAVKVVRGGITRFAAVRKRFSGVLPQQRYGATARTGRCDSGIFQTMASASVAGHRLVKRSRPTLILCDVPANSSCNVTAHAPRFASNEIVAQSDLTCASTRNDLVWTLSLEVNQSGQWQDAGTSQQGGVTYQGTQTYHRFVREPCGAEPPPWPKGFRTVVTLAGDRGGTIRRTSAVSSITCPTASNKLTVTLNGTGSGRVTSAPAGIDCPGTCSHSYAAGTTVTLTATPAAGSTFSTWGGMFCGGSGPCQFPLVQDTSVMAYFMLNSGPPGSAG